MDASGVISFIGIGSNQGDPAARCNEVLSRMSQTGGIKFLRQSSLCRSEPVGFRKQDWFINAIAKIRTKLDPHTAQGAAKDREQHGPGKGRKWDPRVIDLDILFYGQDVIEGETGI